MKNKLLRSTAFAAALALQSFAADTNMTTAPTTSLGNPVVATGQGVEIKRGDLDTAMAGIRNVYAQQNQTMTPAQAVIYEKRILDELINLKLLLAKATDADKAAAQKNADLQITAAIENAGSKEAFVQRLKTTGLTEADLRAKLIDEATAQAVIQRELKVTVTDDEVKKYYDAHTADYEQPEMARISHIVIFTVDPVTHAALPGDQQQSRRRKVDDLLKAIHSGTDFAALAKQFSEDPGSKADGGELLPFPRGQMAPEIENAAFSMTNNQVSDAISTANGYQIIKLLEKIPPKKTSYLAAIADIKQLLTRAKFAQLAPPYLDGLRKAANVEILDPNLKAAATTPSVPTAP